MMYRSTDLRLIPIDPQFTAGLVSVIAQIPAERISKEEYDRRIKDAPPAFADATVDVVRKLGSLLTKLEGWKP